MSTKTDHGDHERGTFVHPCDNNSYRYPSSIESEHHVGFDGRPIYSKAQRGALKLVSDLPVTSTDDEHVPSFVGHERHYYLDTTVSVNESVVHAEPLTDAQDAQDAESKNGAA